MMKSTLKKKQIVWARTKGHPWWPGIVTQVLDGNQYAINFIGDDSHSILTIDNLFDFQEKFDDFNEKAKKNKKLKEAIQQAQKIQSTQQIKKEKQRYKQSFSEDENKVKKPATRTQFKKPETPIQENIPKSPHLESTPQIQQKKQQLDREFQDLLLLLIAAQLNYDQIKQKLTPLLDYIESQVSQNSTITEILSERKGSILNAIYMILKHQSEQNPDHFFQRDIQQQITRLHDLISKLKNSLLHQFFNAQNIIQDLTQVCQNPRKQTIFQQIINDESKQLQIEKQKSTLSQQQKQQDNLVQSKIKQKKEKGEKKLIKNKDLNQQNQDGQENSLKKEQSNEDENRKDNKPQEQQRVKQELNFNKKIQKKNEIPDQALRRKVCINMLELVQMLGMDEDKAKAITCKIESLGREADPQMRNKYGKLMWNCIVNLDCKLFKKEDLLRLVDENNESLEIWNKLIGQPNDRTRKLVHL